jgi:hypothetical protein
MSLQDKKMASLKDKLYSEAEQVQKTPKVKVARKEEEKSSSNKSNKK